MEGTAEPSSLERLLDALEMPIVVLDGQLRIRSANPPFLELLQLSQRTIVGSSFPDVCSRNCSGTLLQQYATRLQASAPNPGPAREIAPIELTLNSGSMARTVEVTGRVADLDGEGQRDIVLSFRDLPRKRQVQSEQVDDGLRLQAIFDNTVGLLALLQPDGTTLQVNRAALRHCQLIPEQVVGKPIWECPMWAQSPELQESMKRKLWEVAQQGESVQFDVTQWVPEGSSQTTEFTLSPIYDSKGVMALLILEGRDVSVQKRAERQLKELNADLESQIVLRTRRLQLLSEAIAHLGEGVIISTGTGGWLHSSILFVNDAVASITGFTTQTLIGSCIQLFCQDVGSEEFLNTTELELQAGRTQQFEAVNQNAHGLPYDAELLISSIQDARDAPTIYVTILRDVSQRKQDEALIRRSEERLRAILATACDAIITIDYNGCITSVNPATTQLFGYAESELLGENITLLMPEPFRKDHTGYLQGYLRNRRPKIVGVGRELFGQRKDGSTFPIGLTVGEVKHLGLFTGVIRDLSEMKQLQKQVLEIANDEDRRIGHELHDNIQQQLTGLGLLTRSLADSLCDAGAPEAQLAKRIAEQIGHTAQDVHFLSRGLVPVEVDVNGLQSSLFELCEMVAEHSGVECELHCESQVEFTDNFVATNLYRIAQEAINNAIKHSQASHIGVRLDQQLDHFQLKVTDNGCGFDVTDGSTSGHGIGLDTMTYRANLLNGRLIVESNPGRGTTVRCILYQGANSNARD